MMAPVIYLGALLAMFLLAGCADGLAYGERTSISVASVRLNDDPAQPVAIKLGFDREVITVAPAIGGTIVDRETGQRSASGEAVSQFSTFTVSTKAPFLPDGQPDQAPEQPDLLGVQSRFASGGAALEIADDPKVVAAVLGFTPLTRLTGDDIPLLRKLSTCVNVMNLQELKELASTLRIALSESEQRTEQDAKMAITDSFLISDSDQLKGYAARMPSC
jgi:hypothetical protein